MTTPAGGGSLGQATGTIVIRFDDGGTNAATNALNQVGNAATTQSHRVQTAGKTMAATGAVIAAGFLLAIKSAAEFEKQLSAVQAVSGASAAEMEQVRDKALQLGKDTKFSAAEGAQAIEELVKAGISVADVMGGAADATVALAAAGEIALPEAATIAANAMNQFQLQAQQLPHVADLIAGAANASAIGVADLGESLNYVGPVAKAVGVSIDDTATAIAVLGNNGIKGSAAGTALRSVLSNLTPTTKKATQEFKALGLITEDGTNLFQDAATGGIKPLSEVVQLLNDHTAQLSKTEKNTFAKKAFGLETLSAVSVLASQTSDSFDAMAASLNKVSAADVAATRMDNLEGSIEQLQGSFETLMIVVGTPFLKFVTDIVDGLNVMVSGFLALPEPVREIVSVAGALSGAFLLITGGLIVLLPKIAAFRAGLQALAATQLWTSIASGARIATAAIGGPWVAALVLATAALGALFLMHRQGKRDVSDLTEAIKADGNAMAETTRQAVALRLQKAGLLDMADKLGISLTDVTGALTGQREAQDRLNAAIAAIRKPYQDQIAAIDATSTGFDGLAKQHRKALVVQSAELQMVNELAKALGLQVGDLADAAAAADQFRRASDAAASTTKVTTAAEDQLNRALGRASASARDAAGGTKVLADGIAVMGTEADDTEDEVKKLNDAIDRLFGRAFDTPRAINAFKDGLADLTKAAKENGTSLANNTQAGRDNQEAMRRQAEKLGAVITAMREAQEPADAVAAKANAMRREFLNAAAAAGFNRDKVDQLTDVLDEVIGLNNIELNFDTNTTPTIDNVRELERAAQQASGRYPIDFVINTTGGIGALEHKVPGLAKGGIVKKPTLALVGEGRHDEIVQPMPDYIDTLVRIANAGRASVSPALAAATGGSSSRHREASGVRIASGSFTIDKGGRAWFQGLAQDVYDGEDQFATTYGRMG